MSDEKQSFCTTKQGMLIMLGGLIAVAAALLLALQGVGSTGGNPYSVTPTIPQVTIPITQVSVTDTIPKDNKTCYLTISANPNTIAEGESTEINVTVVNWQGTPVPGATVTISTAGGTFLSSREMSVTGKTDHSGIFRTTWGAYPPYIGGGYLMDVQVSTKDWQSSGRLNKVWVNIR
jgi:asparagine N-glycosylation enzyme membrane subunit Stt3